MERVRLPDIALDLNTGEIIFSGNRFSPSISHQELDADGELINREEVMEISQELFQEVNRMKDIIQTLEGKLQRYASWLREAPVSVVEIKEG